MERAGEDQGDNPASLAFEIAEPPTLRLLRYPGFVEKPYRLKGNRVDNL